MSNCFPAFDMCLIKQFNYFIKQDNISAAKSAFVAVLKVHVDQN